VVHKQVACVGCFGPARQMPSCCQAGAVIVQEHRVLISRQGLPQSCMQCYVCGLLFATDRWSWAFPSSLLLHILVQSSVVRCRTTECGSPLLGVVFVPFSRLAASCGLSVAASRPAISSTRLVHLLDRSAEVHRVQGFLSRCLAVCWVRSQGALALEMKLPLGHTFIGLLLERYESDACPTACF
jgi:hypothetical protein